MMQTPKHASTKKQMPQENSVNKTKRAVKIQRVKCPPNTHMKQIKNKTRDTMQQKNIANK